MASHFLYISHSGLSAYVRRKGRLIAEGPFPNTPSGLADFNAYLESRRKHTLVVLANLRDQCFTVETIPFLRGKDRQAIIKRKLDQCFPGYTLATIQSLGYEKDRRKNERLLLSAFPNPSELSSWLDKIAVAEAPLLGIHSISQLTGALAPSGLRPPSSYILLTFQDESLRESFVVDEKTVFSRLVTITSWNNADLAQLLAGEAVQLHKYLAGRNMLDSTDPLSVLAVCHPHSLAELTAAFAGLSHLRCIPINSHLVAKQMGIEPPPQDNRIELLLLHSLANKRPKAQFADPPRRLEYRLRQAKRVLAGITATSVLASLPIACYGIYESHLYQQERERMQAGEKELARLLQEKSAGLPQAPLGHEALGRLVTRIAELQQDQRYPLDSLYRISHAMDQVPAIDLESIEWKIPQGGHNFSDCCGESINLRGTLHLEQEIGSQRPSQALAQFNSALEKEAFLVRRQPGQTQNIPISNPREKTQGRKTLPFAYLLTRQAKP